jgi:hypothetical protein
VPRSRWLGREPREVTRYEYDEYDRLTAAVTEREPEWLDDDREWLLALLAEQRNTCSGCGHPVDISHDPDTAKTWRLQTSTCQACLVLDMDRHNAAEAGRPRLGRYTAVTRRG